MKILIKVPHRILNRSARLYLRHLAKGEENCRKVFPPFTLKKIVQNKFYRTIQESRIQAITEQSSRKFTELCRKKYRTFMKNFQSSVFCPEKFRKFYRTLFCNRLYPRDF